MFRPIQNFINYIQKKNSTTSSTPATSSGIMTESVEAGSAVTIAKLSMHPIIEANGESSEEGNLIIPDNFEGEEDIELAIQSAVVKKAPVRITFETEEVKEPKGLDVEDDELADFRDYPSFNTEEEDDMEVVDEKVPLANEIVVLHENDLNSSIASEPLSEDPLALDDFISATKESIVNPLDASTTDDATTSDDVIWLKVEHIKTTKSPDKETIQEKLVEKTQAEEKASSHEELRSESSDSGLGSENSTLITSATESTLISSKSPNLASECPSSSPINDLSLMPTGNPANQQKPLRSNLKRRRNEDELDVANKEKKIKRNINFEGVKVYYFPRQQGFGCVPSAGGCTLGMGPRHIAVKTLTLAEHAAELRRQHRLQLQESHPRSSSSDETETSEEDYLSDGSSTDLDAESNGYLTPVSPKQRRALLKAAGVRKIDAYEKIECRNIRTSRETCGCSCRDFCDPETCACSQAGIKCQVDRAMFPCGCSRESCGNLVGRVEFNPSRVRTHFIHTVMRLEMENRQQHNPAFSGVSTVDSGAGGGYLHASAPINGTATMAAMANASSNYYNHPIQPQSNYSSGYASPAYTNDQISNYFQQPSGSMYGSDLSNTAAANSASHYSNVDASLFSISNATNATPSYGEMMQSVNDGGGYHQSMVYGSNGNEMLTQLSSYAVSYHQASNSSYIPPQQHQLNCGDGSMYSPCAVASVSQYGYGAPTTTTSDVQYQSMVSESVADANRPAVCLSLETGSGNDELDVNGGGSSFINLNSPIPSSSRLSQINDMLQQNRNTTTALVAVTPTPHMMDCNVAGTSASNRSSESNSNDSTNTSLIEHAQERLAFDKVQPRNPLHPVPLMAGTEAASAERGTRATEERSLTKPLDTGPPPPIQETTSSAIASDSPALVAVDADSDK